MLLAGGNRPKGKDDVVEFRPAEADLAWFRAENQSQQMILIVEGLYKDTFVERDISFLKAPHCGRLKATKTVFEALGFAALKRACSSSGH
jgi:hypothetical protein